MKKTKLEYCQLTMKIKPAPIVHTDGSTINNPFENYPKLFLPVSLQRRRCCGSPARAKPGFRAQHTEDATDLIYSNKTAGCHTCVCMRVRAYYADT
jgi:hypothetical protein